MSNLAKTLDFVGLFCMSNLKTSFLHVQSRNAEFPHSFQSSKPLDLLGFFCMFNLTMLDFPSFLHLKTAGLNFPNILLSKLIDFLAFSACPFRHLQTYNDRDHTHKQSMPKTPPHTKEERSVHYHHRKKIIWQTFWASRSNFRAGGRFKNLSKSRRPYLPPKSFFCDPPSFQQSKAGGVWSFFPARTRTHLRNCLCNGVVCN